MLKRRQDPQYAAALQEAIARIHAEEQPPVDGRVLITKLDIIKAAGSPMMSRVFDFLEANGIGFKPVPASEENDLFFYDMKTKKFVINVGVSELSRPTQIAAQIAKSAKYISQRLRQSKLYAWEKLEIDANLAKRSISYFELSEAYKLPSLKDEMLLRLVNRIDAQIFSALAEREMLGAASKNAVEAQQTVIQSDPILIKLVEAEILGMSKMLDILHIGGCSENITPYAHIIRLPREEVADSCAGLWADQTSSSIWNDPTNLDRLSSYIEGNPRFVGLHQKAYSEFKHRGAFARIFIHTLNF